MTFNLDTDAAKKISDLTTRKPNSSLVWLNGGLSPGDGAHQWLRYVTSGRSTVSIDDKHRLFTGPGADDYYESTNHAKAIDARAGGLVGDGVTNDTAAMQAMIDWVAATDQFNTISFPAGTYLCNDNFYLHGEVNLIGEPGAVIANNSDLALSDGSLYWIVAGISAYGVPVAGGWHDSVIRGLEFQTGADSVFGRGINLIQVTRVTIDRCFFDFRPSGITQISPIEALNNANWNPGGTNEKLDIAITNNRMLAEQDADGGEGMGLGPVDGFYIAGNYVEGFGDDYCGLHAAANGIIIGNHFKTLDGRCMMNNCVNVGFISNYVERIEDSYGGQAASGSLVHSEFEIGGTNPAPTNLRVIGNHLKAPSWFSSGYGIRLKGVQGAIVANNLLEIGGTIHGIVVEPAFFEGWTGPSGNPDEATGGTSRPRDVVVCNNIVRGPDENVIGTFGSPSTDLVGPFVFTGNIAPSFKVYAANVVFRDNVATRTADGLDDVEPYPNSMDRHSWEIASLSSTTFTAMTVLGTSQATLVAHRPGRIMGFQFHGSPDPEVTDLVARATINAVEVASDKSSGIPIDDVVGNRAEAGIFEFDAGDKLGVVIKQDATETGGPFDVRIDLLLVWQ